MLKIHHFIIFHSAPMRMLLSHTRLERNRTVTVKMGPDGVERRDQKNSCTLKQFMADSLGQSKSGLLYS